MVRSRAAVVVLGGGSGSRVGAGVNKVYLPLAGRRVVSWSLQWAAQVPEVGTFVLVVRPEDAELAVEVLRREARGLDVRIVVGGPTRHASEDAALAQLAPEVESGAIDVIAVHDGARPLAGPALFRSVITTADAVGGAVPALPAVGVLPVGSDGQPHRSAPETPSPHAARARPDAAGLPGQGPARPPTRPRTRSATRAPTPPPASRRTATWSCRPSRAARQNLKVTYPHDLVLAEQLLAAHQYRLP